MTQLARVLPTESRAAGPQQISALWLALLASPIAASANSPVLILPAMADSFGVRTATVTWLVTVFAWAMAIGTPLMATLLRRRGTRLTLAVGSTLIVAGTLLVAVAPWLPLAMAGRAAQAVGGAGLATVAMTLAGTARRMGAITAGFGILGAVGPLVGSLIAEAASWRAALAISLVALLAVPAVIRRSPAVVPAATVPFDGRGAALLVCTASALVLVPRYPAPAVAAAIVMGAVLAAHIRSRPDGFVPAALLRSPAFVASTLLACALATSYFTLLLTIPQLLRERTEWSTAAIGVGQLVALLIGSALSLVLAAAAVRIGRSRVLAVLIAVGALAPLTAVMTPWAPLLLVAATLAVFATTGGQATLAVYATAAAPESQRPTTIGLFNLCYQLGGAFGPAIAALIVLG
ncbi:MFS transporter [Rhodococcus maanshanensis]|uniref:MFS transporter n=1 Tax=Rhodococcus maanshanensis TaxID=183556 RepID=UPI0022B403FC|nr:MFS transporter [Rhodococcus maanshanensis]MCZ4559105.1 MFS transporter [Rhodococcus maanshanensis]